MQPEPPNPEHNRVLSALSPGELKEISSQATLLTLPSGHVMRHSGDAIGMAFFPVSGLLASFTVLPTGDQVAVATIGPEGMAGVAPLLGIDRSPNLLRVQITSTGYQVPPPVLRTAFDRSPAFRRAVLGHVGSIVAQLGRSAGCNRFHSQRQRVARWLLSLTQCTDGPSVEITHELLAQMLGGPRHAISNVISEFRSRGLVQQVRGAIAVLDAASLSEIACDCSGTSHDERLSQLHTDTHN